MQWNPLGKLYVNATGEGVVATFHCDRFVEFNRQVLALSVSGPSTQVKALRAFLLSGAKGELQLQWPEETNGGRRIYNLAKCVDGYFSPRPAQMAGNYWHLVASGLTTGFMNAYSDDALWGWIKRHTTTPMLRAWLPEVKQRLVNDGKLVMLEGFNCEPALVKVEDGELDAMVADAMANGDISIPRRYA